MSCLAKTIELPPLYILCGGKGSRLGEFSRYTPKSLVPVLGEPFLARQLGLLKRAGFKRVTLCTGHFGDQIADFVANFLPVDSTFQISCVQDPPELIGTGGALARAASSEPDQICFTYGDSYLDIDYISVSKAYFKRKSVAMMTIIERSLVEHAPNVVAQRGKVLFYGKEGAPESVKYVDYGFSILSAPELRQFAQIDLHPRSFDLGAFLAALVGAGKLDAFELSEPFHEIGTPAGLAELEQFLQKSSANRSGKAN